MACLRICAFLVPILAVLGPIGLSAVVDGKFWDLFPAWDVKDMPELSGKVAIVTGPTVRGIGFESAVEMARKGAQVILAGRSEGKGAEAMKELMGRVPNAKAEFMKLDLGSLQSVKDFATQFLAKNLPLHVLMNSAGVMANPFELTVDGYESQFATNHLGHFLLTKLLLPKLEASMPSRVVTVSSAAAFIPEMLAKMEFTGLVDSAPSVDFEHLGEDYKDSYSPFKAYGRSKLANVLFTRALARRLKDKQIFANVCHPGGIHTNLAKHVLKESEQSFGQMASVFQSNLQELIFLSPLRGAVTQLYLATSPEIESQNIRGQYYRPQAMSGDSPKFSTEELEEKLWALSEKLVAKYLCQSHVKPQVSQHFIFAQSEPRLFLSLCNQDSAATSRILGNTSGVVGLLSLLVNQAGGRLSDCIGRKPGFLIGPLSNIVLGLLVFRNPWNRTLVTVCRVLRVILTTFSNTVMCTAALADVCSSSELALAMSKVQAATGMAMLLTPFIEGRILNISPWSPKGIRYVYAAMAAIAATHAAFVATQLEETLDVAKRSTAPLSLAMINPLGFVRVFTEGTKALRKLVVITTLQMFLEGKNLSDAIQTWIRDKLQWSVNQVRNFMVGYGLLCTITGMSATPWMLKNLSPRGFTTTTNLLNLLGFSLRGLAPRSWLFLAAMVPMLPGVNGASATALKAVAQDLATKEGFGKGEFSAWVNNLRAVAGAVAPVMYGQVYAALENQGRNPGFTFTLAGLVGSLLPQALLTQLSNSEMIA
ncbi:unnamed protein product [Effrenium voratum]|uniref:Uncharacterized protein n=1 Tax=Effrenium voratum TaxID=2562239 RepID=A0AA36NIF7_9DINO|nr:unnamed protein product [Effrenium voratum]